MALHAQTNEFLRQAKDLMEPLQVRAFDHMQISGCGAQQYRLMHQMGHLTFLDTEVCTRVSTHAFRLRSHTSHMQVLRGEMHVQ